MIGRFTRWPGALVLGMLALFAPATEADPLLITNGTVRLRTGVLGSVLISGSNFAFTLRTGEGLPADTFPVDAVVHLSGPIRNDPWDTEPTRAVLDGVVYQSHDRFPPNYVILSLFYDAAPFVANTPNALAMFTTPFTLTGRVQAFRSLAGGEPPLFDVAVAGRGILSIGWMKRIDPATWRNNGGEMLFTFEPQVTPVPEPATLLLLGSSVGVLAMSRRCRDRRKLVE